MSDSSPPFTETALLSRDAGGRQIVSIHAKRTYRLLPTGKCVPAEVLQPLLTIKRAGDDPVLETDVIPYKTATDLIVLASAHAPSPGTRKMVASIALGQSRWDYAIFGDRRCSYRGKGAIAFSEPESFEKISLRHENAYGGVDEQVPDPPIRALVDAFQPHPGIYSRNSAGRGYVVHEKAEAIEGLLLPNVELPGHLLTPQNLVTGGPENWWRQPLPWSCDWFHNSWYPRAAFYGALPPFLPDDDSEVAEVRRGWIEPGQNRRFAAQRQEDAMDSRLGNAASPALVLPFLRGGEAIQLSGMTPDGQIVVRLPGERPRMLLRFEGEVHEIEPVPHRVLVSTDEMGVYVVWHGAWPTPRELPERLPEPGEDASMELEGIEVVVDRRAVAPLV
jgi:hypothetical protein